MVEKSTLSRKGIGYQANGAAVVGSASAPFVTRRLHIRDATLCKEIIQDRQRRGIDGRDEVWEGVYVVPPLANNPHQSLVASLTAVFHDAITLNGLGQVLPGANVSDRREGWEMSFRVPDLVVVLNGGRAVDCTTHWFGGPDFLLEIASPGDDTEDKLPFYERIGVREVLVLHRDSRALRFYQHDGQRLALAGESKHGRKDWLTSSEIPFAFRWKAQRGVPATEVKRRDKRAKNWVI